MAERYALIIKNSTPTLTEPQWCAICDGLNGIWIDEHFHPRFILIELSDADKLNGLGEKWKVNITDMIHRFDNEPIATLTAIVEVSERFSLQCTDDPGVNTTEALRNAGAKIAHNATPTPEPI